MSEVHDALSSLTDEERKYVLTRSYSLFAAYYFDLKMDDYQGEMVKFADDHRRALMLIPAGHCKTTTFGKINLIRHICWNPNIRTILTMSVYDDASEYCKSIQHELTDNKLLVDDYGPFYNAANWTASQFTVRGRQHNDPHATLEVFGTGSWKQKGHGCEIVIPDDVVTEETCSTPEARRKQSSWFRMAVQTGPRPMWTIDPRYGLRVPKGITWPQDAPYNPKPGEQLYGCVWVTGTRFDANDLYQELDDDETYETLLLDCWTDKEETKPLWPGFWTNEALHAERRSLGPVNFNKRYRNNPMDASQIVFKREWFEGTEGYPGCFNEHRSYGELPTDEEGKTLDLFKPLGFDPASGKSTVWSAWPTWVLQGFLRTGNPALDKRYVIDAFRSQTGVEEQIDIMLDGNPKIPHEGFYKKYHYDVCRVEENGFANLLLTHHRLSEAKRRGVYLEPHITGRNKIDPVLGVKSMEAIFRDGFVDFPYKTAHDREITDEIVDQFVFFAFDRQGRKKSLCDYVMAYWFGELAIRDMRPPRPPAKRKSPFIIKNPYYRKRETVTIRR